MSRKEAIGRELVQKIQEGIARAFTILLVGGTSRGRDSKAEGRGSEFRTLQPSDRLTPPAFPISLALRSKDMATSRGEIGIMPQDMEPSPNTPKKVLLKIPYRFNTGHQLLARRSASVLYG